VAVNGEKKKQTNVKKHYVKFSHAKKQQFFRHSYSFKKIKIKYVFIDLFKLQPKLNLHVKKNLYKRRAARYYYRIRYDKEWFDIPSWV